MSKYNKRSMEPAAAAKTAAWAKQTCPLVYIYAPFNTGKTTLLGSLFLQPSYYPVHFIDGDNGGTAIGEYVTDPRTCNYVPFQDTPDRKASWMHKQIAAAQKAKCGAIVIEGLTSVHQALVAQELANLTSASGEAPSGEHLWGAYRPAATHMLAFFTGIRGIKEYRRAKGTGVPIFVTLNTKITKVGSGRDLKDCYVPDWSDNCTARSGRTADGYLELMRTQSGTTLVATRDPELHPYCKLRNKKAAELVTRQTNLSLPGLLTAWATTIDDKGSEIRAQLDKYYNTSEQDEPNT